MRLPKKQQNAASLRSCSNGLTNCIVFTKSPISGFVPTNTSFLFDLGHHPHDNKSHSKYPQSVKTQIRPHLPRFLERVGEHGS